MDREPLARDVRDVVRVVVRDGGIIGDGPHWRHDGNGRDEGRRELMGGTGKYAGLSGACACTAAYPSGDRVVGQARCEWRKP